MRLLHDAGRRLPIAKVLAAIALAAVALIGSQTFAQTGVERIPPDNRAPAAAGRGTPAAGPRTAAQPSAGAPAGPGATAAPGPRMAKNGGQAPAAGAAPAAGPPAAVAPFQLNSREEELLDKLLVRWEAKNSSTKTFKCTFVRFEYDAAIKDPEVQDHQRSTAKGEVKYKQPDHGMFHVTELTEYDEGSKKYEKRSNDGLEHWVCDGAAIYEFVPAEKKLKVHPLPKEMQGDAIADGPIPFIFGAKADKMKQRYWLREVTRKEDIGKHILLEAVPKYQHDAVNFSSALLLLNTDFTIKGLQVTQPGGKQRTAFMFSDVVINDPFSRFKGDFTAPKTPPNWTKEVDPTSDEPQQPEPQRPAATAATIPAVTVPAATTSPGTARKPSGAAAATPTKR